MESDKELIYQSEIKRAYTKLLCPEWKHWWSEEVHHVPFYHKGGQTFSYVETETLQVAITAGVLSEKGVANDLPQSAIFWSPRMTQTTALKCVIYQYSEIHSEKLLFREAPKFYEQKFRQASSSPKAL